MRRVNRQGCQHRKQLGLEHGLHPVDLGDGQRLAVHQLHGRLGQARPQLAPDALLVAHQLGRVGLHAREDLGRGQPVLARHAHAFAHLALQPATRTMKNSSRLLAEIETKRSRSRSG